MAMSTCEPVASPWTISEHDFEPLRMQRPRRERTARSWSLRSIIALCFLLAITDQLGREIFLKTWTSRVAVDVGGRSGCGRLPREYSTDYSSPMDQSPVHDVSMITRWYEMIGLLASLPLSILFGFISDRFGRRPVLIANVAGQLLGMGWIELVMMTSMNLRWTGAAHLFQVFGVGSFDLISTVLADVTTDGSRTIVFYMLQGLRPLISLAVSKAYAHSCSTLPTEWLMAAYFFLTLHLFLATALPETLERPEAKTTDAVSLLHDYNQSGAIGGGLNESTTRTHDDLFEQMRITNSSFGSRNFLLLLATFFLNTSSTESLVSLVTSRLIKLSFKSTILSTTVQRLLVSSGGVLLIIYPILNYIFTYHFRCSAPKRDVIVARGAIGFSALACLLMLLPTTIPTVLISAGIGCMGLGYAPTVRSILVTFVQEDEVGRAFGCARALSSLNLLLDSMTGLGQPDGLGTTILNSVLLVGVAIITWFVHVPDPRRRYLQSV